jgi:drug/metabolite transporter (DMT)-like permease
MTLAVLVMVAAQPKRVFLADRKTVLYGVLLGLLLGSGYITQTIGLKMTTAAITGFITGMYVVFTPILTMVFAKTRTSGRVWIGVVLATVGLGFISIKAGFAGIGAGELWVLACAMFFALHFTGLGSWSPGRDSY